MKALWGRSVVDYLPSLVTWLAVIVYLVTAWGYNAEARLFPLMIGLLLFVLLPLDVLILAETAWGARLRATINPASVEPTSDSTEQHPLCSQIVALAYVFGFATLLVLIGVLPAIAIYVTASVRSLGRRNWPLSLTFGAVLTSFTYALFVVALDIPLYSGLLFDI